MNRDTARQTIRSAWRQILPTMTSPAKRKVNGETSFICPICGHGKNGDGLTFNPRSNGGSGLKCFSCGFAGDIIDLYQQTTESDYNTALQQLAQQLNITIEANRPAGGHRSDFEEQGHTNTPPAVKAPQNAPRRPQEATPDYTAYYQQCRERLHDPAAVSYLQARGISTETAAAYWIGFDPEADPAGNPGGTGTSLHPCPRLIIPTTPAHYTGRRIDGGEEYKKMNPKGSTAGFFNVRALYAQEVRELFITEGAFDALSIIEAGAAAMALNSTVFADAFIKKLEQRPTGATLILCLDKDDAGRKATLTIQQGLDRLHIPYITADVCGKAKDPNEALIADRPGFIAAVEAARQEASGQRAAADAERQREVFAKTGAGMVDCFLEDIESENYKPFPTGIKAIDDATGGGFMRQTLVLLGAEPGAGKTALASMIFENMAKRGASTLFFNLEMSRNQLIARSLARMMYQLDKTQMSATEILQGYKHTEAQRAAINAAASAYKEDIADGILYNPGDTGADLDRILECMESEARRAEAADQPAPLVVIDYLQLLTSEKKEDAPALIKRAVAGLKSYAIKYNSIVFAIQAQGRAANSSREASMAAGRDTSALEYSADLQMQLIREDAEQPELITLYVTKNRFGMASTKWGTRFTFMGAQSLFVPIDERHSSAPLIRL